MVNTDHSGRVVCQQQFDAGCIYEEQLKAEFNVDITYPNSTARSPRDPFLKCLNVQSPNRDPYCVAGAAYWWFVDTPDLQDLRKVLLETLRTIDNRTNNAVSRSYKAQPFIKFDRSFGVYLGEWKSNDTTTKALINTIYLYDGSIAYAGLGRSGFEWIITHEVGHSIDTGFSIAMLDAVEIAAMGCSNSNALLGPTWYTDNDGTRRNVALLAGRPSEDFSESFALYVWGMNHPFYQFRKADQPGTTIGDGRPGIPVRMRFMKSIGF